VKKATLICLILTLVFFCKNIFADDDTEAKIQTGIGVLGSILNQASKSNNDKKQATHGAAGQIQEDNQKAANEANVQKPEPSFSKENILMLMSKIRTNLGSDEVMGIMNSPFHIIAFQVPEIKFGQLFCLFGEGQLSLEQKKKIFGDFVADSKGKWQTKIVSFNKTNEDTLAVEFDLMVRNDPTESPKPRRRIFYFRYISPGETMLLIQIKAFGTKQGDVFINNDAASGYIAEQVFQSFYEGIMLFLGSGNYQFNGT